MRYTKEAIIGGRYTRHAGVIKLKRRRVLNKLYEGIAENKFIITIILSITILTAVNLMLVNKFMNLLIGI